MSAGGCTIRPAAPADLPAMEAIVEAAYQRYVPRIGRRPGPMDDDLGSRIEKGEAFVALAGDPPQIVGLLVLIDTGEGLLLDNVAVDPTAEGAGFGSALIAFAEDCAAEKGYAALRLYTHEAMTENIAFYQRRGYRIVARRREKGFDRVYMEKPIQAAVAVS